jgi:flagellum-specific peptidoglycan hydrolase FlgJ
MRVERRIVDQAPPRVEVEARRTPASRAEIRSAIARAAGPSASGHLVDVLTAQACLETASGDRMYNYNFGGIKGRGTAGTAVLRTTEVIGGNEQVVRDGFRAYRTLDEGAADFVKTVGTRFRGAIGAAEKGDVAGFAHALKQAGYYTASEDAYARGLERLVGADGNATRATLPSSAHVAKFESSLDASGLSFDLGFGRPSHKRESDDDDDA